MKYYKLFLCLVLAGIILTGLFLFPKASAHADTPVIEVSEGIWVVVEQPLTIPQRIARYSALYGVSYQKLYGTLSCESRLSPSAIGDQGRSYGIAQIFLPAHPSISKEEALDPDFAIRFAAKEFADGNASSWTCYKLLYM